VDAPVEATEQPAAAADTDVPAADVPAADVPAADVPVSEEPPVTTGGDSAA